MGLHGKQWEFALRYVSGAELARDQNASVEQKRRHQRILLYAIRCLATTYRRNLRLSS